MNDVKKPATRGPRKKKSSSLTSESSQQDPLSRELLQSEASSNLYNNRPQNTAQHSPQETRSLSVESRTLVSPSSSYGPLTPPLDCETTSVGDWLELIYECCFENVFGFWMGRHCCALVADNTSAIILPPSRYFPELDDFIFGSWRQPEASRTDPQSSRNEQQDHPIDQSLKHAKRSFAARWFHLIPSTERAGVLPEHVVREFWRKSRRDMLKVINRISYRSALALFLFSLTPVPVGISEEEEMDGLTGQLCVQAGLQQIQRLREGQRSCQFSGSQVLLASDALATPTGGSKLTDSFLRTEARAYWAALTFDTSSSLSLNFRSTITSGLHGVETETCWRTLKMGAGSFHTRTEGWRRNPFAMTEDEVLQVIAAALACKLYVWKMISVVKEALREGSEEDKVQHAWSAFLEAIDMFRGTFRPLLNDCQRRLPFLGQVERLNWYELMLHYYLGILILVDAMEAAERTDLLSQFSETRLEAEHELFNTLKFGLESQYTINGACRLPGSTSNLQNLAGNSTITASFIAIDPYPHHIVAAAQLMNKVVSREYSQGKIKLEAYRYLNRTLLECLEQLPQTSKSVQAARQHLRASAGET
ncbi:hypothetical protein G647_09899 [Cladophialophora carrionii CBS 160.54]|uniref:Transcription factor domain-containing protein n=1 Tax=Cladophialophora carrionii CBS 160.54 TaxID=1279043 RepID=V9DKH8_9EURO|nr:uncharacterized protein G647_09899 [Cladophialophora carrionii CBS 160.54]ETI27216.1 hypothetical protein G647_09899 [Cladophialophora carrionii CBS 160.54]